jgi:hypothetical protein
LELVHNLLEQVKGKIKKRGLYFQKNTRNYVSEFWNGSFLLIWKKKDNFEI